MERKDKAGEDETKIAKPGSQYNKILSSLSPQKNTFCLKYFPTVLGFIWLLVIWPTRGNFQPGGSPHTGVRIGGVMTGVTGLWEGKSTWLLDPKLPPSQVRANRLLLKSRQMYWTSGRGIDPRAGVLKQFFRKCSID